MSEPRTPVTGEAGTAPFPWIGWRHAVLVVLLLAVFAAQVLTATLQKSATFDEPVYLSSGYATLTRGDHRLMPMHPPLTKILAALPFLAMDVDGCFDTWGYAHGAVWVYAWEFLYHRNDADQLLFVSRCIFVTLGVVLGALVYAWARTLYGRGGGVLALFLFAFSPNLLAHAGLATTDFPATLFVVAALFSFDRALGRLALGGGIRTGVLWGAALLAKHTAWLLGAVFPIFFFVRFLSCSRRERPGWCRCLSFAAVLAVAVWGTIWAGYGFSYATWGPHGEFWHAAWKPPEAPLRFLWERHLLPQPYLEGMHQTRITMGRRSFLDGAHSPVVTVWRGDPPAPVERLTGWPHYFVMTFLYKTPVAGLLLFVLAAAVSFSRRLRLGVLWQEALLWILSVVLFAAVSASGMNIGHRHVLPILPAGIILIARIVPAISRFSVRLRRPVWTGLAALLVWYAASALKIHPHHLAYFNEIAGGPENGPWHLTESNIDWGQDLKLLAQELRRRGIPEIHLSYLGTADPAYYGICYQVLPGYTLNFSPPSAARRSVRIESGDYVAVSVTNLMETYEDWPELMGVIRTWEPLVRIGYSIYLYRAPQDLVVPPPRRN